MDHGNRTPVWPVQFILLGLFLAAVLAPRAWEQIAHRRPRPEPQWSPHSRWGDAATRSRRPASDSFDRVSEADEQLVERAYEPAVVAEVRWKPVFPQLPPTLASPRAPRNGVSQPWGDSRLNVVFALLHEPLRAHVALEASEPRLLAAATPTYRPAMRMPTVRRVPKPAAWWPEELLTRLAQLSDDPRAGLWAWQVAIVVDDLGDASRDADDLAGPLAELERLADVGREAADRCTEPVAGPRWRRAVHALERRIRLWRVGPEAELAADLLGVYTPTIKTARSSTALALSTLIERYESDPGPAVARRLAAALERLSTSDSQAGRALAAQFEHANLRLSVSEQLLARLVPAVPDSRQRVRETMDGAQVRGESNATRRLRVEMVPDPEAFHLLLAASGEITARTVASKGPGRWFNRADGQVDVTRELLLGPGGFQLTPAQADATASLRILDVRTKIDGLPIFDELLRITLRNAGERKTPQARRRFQSRVEREAVAELEQMSDRQVASLERLMDERLQAPLREMGVEARWVAGQTTEQRASLRLRIAGPHQLGAHTPRPRAPGHSLASLQLHQSACNNVVEQFGLAGRTFTLPELFDHVAGRLQRPAPAKIEGLPEGVSITFAEVDPVQVAFRDGAVELALRVQRLTGPDQTWRDFVVRASYSPDAETGRLEREEAIRLASTRGTRLSTRSQIALRSIFTKVFSKNQRLNLLKPLREREGTADLTLCQFKAEDGWLAVAITAAPNQPAAASRTRREVTR